MQQKIEADRKLYGGLVERPGDVEDNVGQLLEHPLYIPRRGTLAWGIRIRRNSKGPCLQGMGKKSKGLQNKKYKGQFCRGKVE